MKKLLFALIIILPLTGIAQEDNTKKFGIRFSGFVKTDIFYDSRATLGVREGHFMLYPANEQLNDEGDDLLSQPSLTWLSIQTRLKGTITGPDALGAKTSGIIEGEFFGTTDSELNGFRLRHALVKLDWTATHLLVGYYWHPMFNTKCFPGTVSFNTGAPFMPFARNPQARLSQDFGDFSTTLTAYSQLDFVSTGPDGASASYLKNALVPALNLRLEYLKKNSDNGAELLVGVSGNYKLIQPRTVTENNFKTDTKLSSTSLSYFLKYKNRMITIKLHGFNGGDATDLVMLGGYAVKEVTDTIKGFAEYTPIRNNSFWADIHTNGKRWQFGIFGGYTKNQGAKDEIKGNIYSRGSNIDYVYRASGRVIFNSGKFRVAPEIEYTVAAYARVDEDGNIAMDEKGRITDSKEIGNFRFLIGVYYFF